MNDNNGANSTNRKSFLKYAYEAVNSDLKFAETKNTFLITLNLAVIGSVFSFLFKQDVNLNYWARLCLLLFEVLIIIATIVSIVSFFPASEIGKYLSKPKKEDTIKLMFYQTIYSRHNDNLESFQKEIKTYLCDSRPLTPYEEQFSIQILNLSSVAYTKFDLFTKALILELISSIFLISSFILPFFL